MTKKKPIGGQAVIEGVMMKSGSKVAVAVRKPGGRISVDVKDHKPWTEKSRFLSFPFVRGFVELMDMMVTGIRALTYSANESSEDDEKLGSGSIALTMIISAVFAIALFVALPLAIASLASDNNSIWFDMIDGFARLAIFIAYVFIISRMKDIRTVFQYHGAEHCTVHCYEAGKKLTPANASRYSTVHPRCGTSFMVIVIAISILLFAFVSDPRWHVKFISRILLLPAIAGISYEILKLSSKHTKNPFVRIIMLPGLLVQKITTLKPTKRQIEVAIVALNKVR